MNKLPANSLAKQLNRASVGKGKILMLIKVDYGQGCELAARAEKL